MTGELELREAEETTLADAVAWAEDNPTLVIPGTGELIDLTRPAAVADGLLAIRELERELRDRKDLLSALLRAESRRMGTKTLHLANGRTATISGGPTTGYDPERLAAELAKAGCPEERVADVVHAVVTWKVNRAKLKSVIGANPLYGEAASKAAVPEEQPWYVSVK